MKNIAIGVAIIGFSAFAAFFYGTAVIYALSWLGLGGTSSDMIGGEGHWISTERFMVAMTIPGLVGLCYFLGKAFKKNWEQTEVQEPEAFEIHNRFCGENGEPCQACRLKAEKEK